MVVVRFVPEAVWTAAVKFRVPPSSIEVVVLGVSVTFPANRGGPALPPPHAGTPNKEVTAIANHRPLERNLPMDSSFLVIMPLRSSLLGRFLGRYIARQAIQKNWKTCSVERETGISKRAGAEIELNS